MPLKKKESYKKKSKILKKEAMFIEKKAYP
jgi:hypothetical protein